VLFVGVYAVAARLRTTAAAACCWWSVWLSRRRSRWDALRARAQKLWGLS